MPTLHGKSLKHHIRASMTISIELPYLPPKEFSRNSRVHWTALHRVKDQVYDDILITLLESGFKKDVQPLDTATVTFTFYIPDKRNRDADNLITSAKPMLDGLVRAGVIADDNLMAIGVPVYKWESRPRKPGTLITVE